MKPFLLVLFCFIFFSRHKISVTGKKENQNKCLTACPKGWEKKGGRCFLWLDPVLSWENTEEICNDEGGHLASVTNLEIHNYIRSKVNPKEKNTFFWIGGTAQGREGKWKWTDGSEWKFTKWATKQPDNYLWGGGWGEDCVQIYHGRAEEGWSDQSCGSKLNFVCSQRVRQNDTNNNNTTATTNDTSSSKDFPVLAVALSSSGVFLVVIVLITVACAAYRCSKKKEEEMDENTVYYGVCELGEGYERRYSTNEIVFTVL